MAYTFLQAVNITLRQTGLIQSDLASFTDTSIQRHIDTMKESWNEAIDEVNGTGLMPQETAEGTLTLATSKLSYSFSTDMSITDFVRMASDPYYSTEENTLTEYPGGWKALFGVDRSDRNGEPRHWAINTSNGNLEIDSTPTSSENGNAYTFLYEKRIHLSSTSDTFPFSDDVVDALVSAVNQLFSRKVKKEFDETIFRLSLARATRYLAPGLAKHYYGVRRASTR